MALRDFKKKEPIVLTLGEIQKRGLGTKMSETANS